MASPTDSFGFGSSAPIVTSNGTTDGSALVWVVWMADGTGAGAQLRAYDAVPEDGVLQLRFSAPIGTASKFNPPGIGDGRVYVGTREGKLFGFGAPSNQPLTSTPLDLGTVDLGDSASGQVVFTARRGVTVTGVSSTGADFVPGAPTPGLPVTLAAGNTLTIPVTFTPSRVGIRSAAIVAQADGAPVSTPVTGIGRTPTPVLSVTPEVVSFGGTAVNTTVSGTVTLSNVGGADLVLQGVTAPGAPFSASGVPASGTTVGPGKSVTVTLTFAPTQVGTFIDQLVVDSSAGQETVNLSGSAAQPGNLTLSPASLDFGAVSVGQAKVLEFQVTNTGGSRVTVTKSKPPASGVGFTATDSLQEGAAIEPGQTQTLHVQFQPAAAGQVTDHWTINADGMQGLLTLELKGQGQGGSDPGGLVTSGCSSTGDGAPWALLAALLPWARRRRPRAG